MVEWTRRIGGLRLSHELAAVDEVESSTIAFASIGWIVEKD